MTTPKTAMVLAAGMGTRMRPLTDTRPKPLIPVAGKPLIDHMLDRLALAGVERAVVNVHYLADLLEAHLAGRTRPAITISNERGERLETGGGLIKAAPLLGDKPFFVVNTDQVWTENGASALASLAAKFDEARMDVMMLLAPLDNCLGFHGPGDFFMSEAGALSWRGEAETAPWVYCRRLRDASAAPGRLVG
ncbi:MAG: nucleotidyltransferase family protein [Alphaproteobacteria bacterium]